MNRRRASFATLTLAAGMLAAISASSLAQEADPLKPRVKLETTLGDILIELDAEKAPISTNNFINYTEAKFYDGLIFHRVMSTFMIQGGGFSPELDKKNATNPPIKNEWQNGLKNVRGTIAMARTNVPDSATSEFYINVVDNPSLDKPMGGAAYAVFGKVVEGMETVDKIKDTPVKTDPKYPGGAVVPVTPVVIKSAKLIGKYDREKVAAALKKAEEEAKAAAAKAKEAAEKAMAEKVAAIEKETGKKFEKTESGLMYIVLKEGTGAQPKQTDIVSVHYTGTFLDGQEFDSSVKRGQPYDCALVPGKPNSVIKGWCVALPMMKVGEKRKLIIPPDLAYGAGGRPGIPPNSTLVFDVELMGIK